MGYRRTQHCGKQAVKNALGIALMTLNLERLADWARQSTTGA